MGLIFGLLVPSYVLIFIGLRRAPAQFRWFMRSFMVAIVVLQAALIFSAHADEHEAERLSQSLNPTLTRTR